MNTHSTIAAQPEILRLIRGMSDENRHKALQLIIAEFPYADTEADLFLAAAACELIPVGKDDDGNVRSEGDAEIERDSLYPGGGFNMEAARRHRLSLERDILAAERAVNGRAAMMRPGVPVSDAAFHGEGRFGG